MKQEPMIKIICGYRKEQEYTVNADQAHLAYYLWANPEKKAIFKGKHGLPIPIAGADIKTIIPDYNATMGWNPTNEIDSRDWLELREYNVPERLGRLLEKAGRIAQIAEPSDMQIPLRELIREKYAELSTNGTKRLTA